jgi:PAS domain S-box-containing protein
MFILNDKHQIVKTNQATARFTGIPEQQARGLTCGELFKCAHLQANGAYGSSPECEACLLRQNFTATLTDGEPRQGIRASLLVATDLGPATRHLLFSTNLLVNSDQGQVLICIDDISPFIEEHELRIEGDARYRALVEEGFDGIFIHRNNRIVYLNQQMADILGWQKKDLFGRSPLDFVAPKARDTVKAHTKAGTSKIFEVDLIHRDGRTIRVETFGVRSPYRGELANIVAVRDISARAEADQKLHLSEQRYARLFRQFESLLNAVSDPIALLTAELKVLWTNKAYDHLRTELDADEHGLVFPQYFEKMIEDPILDCLTSGRAVASLVLTPDQRVWEYRVFPLRQEESAERQIIIIASDISEKLALREEANQTSRLAALGELAAGVAHEINNPNALILYNSDLLQKIINALLDGLEDSPAVKADFPGELPFEQVRTQVPAMLGGIQRSAQRIKQIVDDLRNFSQNEENPQQELIDFNQVVEAAVRLTGNTIRQHTQSFSQKLSPRLPCILGNSGRLEQVVINLLLNACQALDNPTQRIRVETLLDHKRHQILLKVSDQGRGIDNKMIKRLSEPFFTTRREKGGTGLGLSVSSRIVKEHSGHLSFSSQPQKGTIVTLTLPLPPKGTTL